MFRVKIFSFVQFGSPPNQSSKLIFLEGILEGHFFAKATFIIQVHFLKRPHIGYSGKDPQRGLMSIHLSFFPFSSSFFLFLSPISHFPSSLLCFFSFLPSFPHSVIKLHSTLVSAWMSTPGTMGFPGGAVVKNLPVNAGDARFILWVRKFPWRRKWPPTPVSFPGKFHRQRSLAGYSPWGCKDLDMTEPVSTHTHMSQTLGVKE